MRDRPSDTAPEPEFEIARKTLERIISATGGFHPDFQTEEGYAEKIILAFLSEMEDEGIGLAKLKGGMRGSSTQIPIP